MGKDNNENEEYSTFTLALDDGTNVECLVLTELHVDGNDYVVLQPLDEMEDVEEDDVLIYRFVENEGEDVEVYNIESDEEFEKVEDAFEEYLDDLEFNRLDDEE